MTSHRITSARVADLASRLSDRDRAIVSSVAKLGLVSGQHLERLYFTPSQRGSSARACRRVLERLVALRVLARLERRIGGVRAGSSGFIYALDVAGQRLLWADAKRGTRPRTPSLPFLRHALSVTELFVTLTETARSGALELLSFTSEPRCHRSFAGPGGVRTMLRPDAYVRLGIGDYEDSYFVEVDLATESGPRIAAKLKDYRRYFASGREQERRGVFPRVLFLVPDERRKAFIAQIISREPAESWELFQVALLDRAIETFIAPRP